MVFPLLIPLILVGSTVASVASSALVPQAINEPTKQILIADTKKAIQKENSSINTISKTVSENKSLFLIGALILGVILLR